MPTKKTVAVTGTKARTGKTAEKTLGRNSSVTTKAAKKSRASTKAQTSGKSQPSAKEQTSGKSQPSAKGQSLGKQQPAAKKQTSAKTTAAPVATDSRRGKKAPSKENMSTGTSRENIMTGTPQGRIQQPEKLAQKRMEVERSAAARQMVDTKGMKARSEGVKQAPHTRAVNNRGQ